MSTLEFNQALVDLEYSLRFFAMNFTKNKADAQDLTQETMLKALSYKEYYAPQTNFKAWVFTIMRNTFINQYRRKVKSRSIFDSSKELEQFSTIKGAKETPLEFISTKDIQNKIEELDGTYKTPFEMYFQGFKYQEIGNKLNIPIGTVKSRIFIARKKLMSELSDYSYSN